jgi:hypothetical protein
MIRSSHCVDAHLCHVYAVQNGLDSVKHIVPCHRQTGDRSGRHGAWSWERNFCEHLLLLRRSYRLPYVKFVLSGFHVCGPSVNTASHLHWQTTSWGSASSLSCNLLLPLDVSFSMRRKCERCCVGGKLTNSCKFSCKIVFLILAVRNSIDGRCHYLITVSSHRNTISTWSHSWSMYGTEMCICSLLGRP